MLRQVARGVVACVCHALNDVSVTPEQFKLFKMPNIAHRAVCAMRALRIWEHAPFAGAWRQKAEKRIGGAAVEVGKLASELGARLRNGLW